MPNQAVCAACAQAGVAAETYSNSPGLLRRVLAELLQHTLATFSTILAEQLPGALALLCLQTTIPRWRAFWSLLLTASMVDYV